MRPSSFHHRPRPARLGIAVAALLFASGAHASVPAEQASLLEQRERMPADFREHLFGNPLTVRVELDGQYLGDAEVLLHDDNRLQLIGFVDSSDSPLPHTERTRWTDALAEPQPLGVCTSRCGGLAALHYSLANSLLTLLTPAGATREERTFALPATGSHGLIVRNSLAVHGGQDHPSTARYSAELQGSIGRWSTLGSYQYYAQPGSRAHYLSALYAQRELGDHFMRAGYFLPTFEGIIRQPRAPGTENDTVLGVMFGSSDALLADTRGVSAYPIYVTASREGIVEILRDGKLLSTQAVKPGIQEVDTRRLPGGIYDVELRVIEEAREVSRETASVHKPNRWRDPSRRWRYSAFAGQQRGVLDTARSPRNGQVAVGAVANYLLHPRAIAGATVQQTGDRRAAGLSMDWQASDRFSTYTNAYTSPEGGRGVDLQGL